MDRTDALRIRTTLAPGDLGRITALHGVLYAQEYGWTTPFEAYVAEGLARFGRAARTEADRIWLAEKGDRLVGCIAIVGHPDGSAQLRWFLVHPEARGVGLGRRLFEAAMDFCRARAVGTVFLWTAAGLPAAAHLYRSVGFRLTEEHAEDGWGAPATVQRYELRL